MVLERDDWQRLDTLLQGALDQPSGEREQWIAQACGGDSSLVKRVTKMVRLAEADDELLRPGGALPPTGAEGFEQQRTPSAPELAAGTRLGRYEIRGLLGEGGMGRVYRGLDPTLGREVAIKALSGMVRGDDASLRRFEREARLLANLSHPSIAGIYGFEVLDGSPYLILERVEGETLAERLRRGPLRLREALLIAIQVAEGLEEAHGKGVIHRDLKPSNVMLAPGGRVKLVDFGLAKALKRPREGEASIELATAAGTIVGTAPYMSPEQVQGEEIDTRVDVFAFGCVLYEMLTGLQAFPGSTGAETLGAVLWRDPRWEALPESVPPALHRLLRRCLRKDRQARLQHIGDARLELVEVRDEAPAAPEPRLGRRIRTVLPWAVAALLAGVAALLALRGGRQRPARAQLSLELPRGVTLSGSYPPPFAFVPGGSALVVRGSSEGTDRLYVRGLDDVTLRPLAGTEGAEQPSVSPDGRWVAFFADRKLKKVPLEGGAVVALCEVGSNPRGAAWCPDGSVVLSPSQTSGLQRVPDAGGKPLVFTILDVARGEYSHRWPEVLPGGEWVMFTSGLEEATFDEAHLEVASLKTGERRQLVPGATFSRYAPGGHLLFVRGGRVFSAAFDADRLELRGAPEVVLGGVRYSPQNGAAHLAVSTDGSLLYGPGMPTSAEQYLSWLGADGRLTRITAAPRLLRDPRLSHDGARAAVVIGTSTESDLWAVEGDGSMAQLSFGLTPHRPTWTPGDRGLTVGAQKDGTWRLLNVPADSKAAPTLLLESRYRMYPNAWSPDGRFLVFQQSRPETGWDLFLLPVEGGRPAGPPRPLADTPYHETNAAISPDGRWVAYESDEVDAVVQVLVRSFPDGGHKAQISHVGARSPSWGPHEVFYWDTSRYRPLVAATREEGERLVVEPARPVVAEGSASALPRIVITATGARFDAHSTGEKFLVLETSAESLEPPLTRPVLALGWAEGLRR